MKMRLVITALLVLTIAGCTRVIPLPTQPSDPVAQPPVINSFTADATRLGTSLLDTFLRWDVSGSSDTRCRIDSPGQPSQGIGNVALGGFVQVRPQVSREYTLTCTNAGGTVQRILPIIVG